MMAGAFHCPLSECLGVFLMESDCADTMLKAIWFGCWVLLLSACQLDYLHAGYNSNSRHRSTQPVLARKQSPSIFTTSVSLGQFNS